MNKRHTPLAAVSSSSSTIIISSSATAAPPPRTFATVDVPSHRMHGVNSNVGIITSVSSNTNTTSSNVETEFSSMHGGPSSSSAVELFGGPDASGDADDAKMEKGQGVKDRNCWTIFVGAMFLLSGFVALFIYSMWESPASGATVPVHSFEYFLYCMLGGVLSGLPHTILTPMDLIKCRVQVGEYSSLGEGVKSLWHESVHNRLNVLQTIGIYFRGWVPTFIGYSMQGALKFGLYELFKYVYAYHVFSYDVVLNYRVFLFLFASASAELIADVSLAPWEAVKVKMQTTRTYPPVVAIVVPRMWFTEGANAFFKGLPALWARQVPYTMMKFASFEKTVELIYLLVLRAPKKTFGPQTQLAVSLVSGIIAGALCCVISHPADTVVSKLNQRNDAASASQSSIQFVRELGCRELWKGIGARLVMISTLTAMQWLIYDSFKVAVGLPTTGGGSGGGAANAASLRASHRSMGALTSAPAVSGLPMH